MKQSNGVVSFSVKVSAVAAAFIAVISIALMLSRWATSEVRADIAKLRVEGSNSDSIHTAQMDRIANVVELAVTALVEAPNSRERDTAVAELRRLRRVTR